MKKNDWFCVDAEKRAARVRSYPLGHVLKELLANSLDAGSSEITLTCRPAEGKRRDREKMKAFEVTCTDNGCGCDDHEALRRVGSSTSDLHPEKRGRFGQGLIDVLSLADDAEILMLNHQMVFDGQGYRRHTVRTPTPGMVVRATLRHGGEGFDGIEHYFGSVIVPAGVTFVFNGRPVTPRIAGRTVTNLKLATILYDPDHQGFKSAFRSTGVELYPMTGLEPMIYELGIPVDRAPWALPFDTNVLQKTPLDVERTMLPDKDKHLLF